ncbi:MULTISPECIES: DedA family protein [Synechocystis]|uniref:DedA family protein n=1 Tax=Synechocystis salina LEGE 00031 TaxID=1828736 RepID=A0ABR9VN00_9SYNC|nr:MULTISPECIES: DedA family protein [Synechocystis]MBE9196004.1 DedA family protein [Synechocystis sp. LEGE 06083]MBE9242135.1 DedA family protein [Synechocystis salina LEGE 00041]MBE9252729.1 DedA family protein [Synechocystis salina LEGE 00031]
MSQWITEWIPQVMNQLGYGGISLLMFLENLFPPIPSELIMPLAGFAVAQGKLALFPAIVAGIVGTILGAYPWYYIGKLVSEERLEQLADRYGKWIGLDAKDIHKANVWFGRYGHQSVFLGRLVPGIRTMVSLPAGINAMGLISFTLYSLGGISLWVTFLANAGYKLGNNYDLVEQYLGPVSKIVLVSVAAIIVLSIVRKQLRRRA